jgi:hypothetical protein
MQDFFHKNLHFCLKRLNIRILDDEHDSKGVDEGVTIVSQKNQVQPKRLMDIFS